MISKLCHQMWNWHGDRRDRVYINNHGEKSLV